jgi:hypothetical protein
VVSNHIQQHSYVSIEDIRLKNYCVQCNLPAAVGDHAARTASALRSQMIVTICFRVLLYLVDIYSSHLNHLLINL